MPKYACPICGDPNGFPIWIDEKPPTGCPHDENWHQTGVPAILDICEWQKAKARQRADWRKHNPECFDKYGNILPGQLAKVLTEWQRRNPGEKLVM